MNLATAALVFLGTQLPVLLGAGAILVAAARRWRDRRAVSVWLLAAGGCLLLSAGLHVPVQDGPGRPGAARGAYPLGQVALKEFGFGRSVDAGGSLRGGRLSLGVFTWWCLAAAGVCGIAAVLCDAGEGGDDTR